VTYRAWGGPVGIQRGEGAILARRRSLALLLVVLGISGPAMGGTMPARSGQSQSEASLEAAASRIATTLAGRRVSIDCVDRATWRSLAAQHDFDPDNTWALTPLRSDSRSGALVPDGGATFSPRTCRFAGSFLAKPTESGTRVCSHGATKRWETRRTSRLGEQQRVQLQVPVLGECDDWGSTLLAVHVLGHESMHLAGVIDEAEADCLATQLDAFAASSLGAGSSFARAMAREYWAYYYRSQDLRYRSPNCRDRGSLDLFRGRRGWPTPVAYPPNLAQTIAAFIARAQSN
jgi:hypothetical protein